MKDALSDDEWRDCGILTAYLTSILDEMDRAREIARVIGYTVMLEHEVKSLRQELGRESKFIPLLGIVRELIANSTDKISRQNIIKDVPDANP